MLRHFLVTTIKLATLVASCLRAPQENKTPNVIRRTGLSKLKAVNQPVGIRATFDMVLTEKVRSQLG